LEWKEQARADFKSALVSQPGDLTAEAELNAVDTPLDDCQSALKKCQNELNNARTDANNARQELATEKSKNRTP